MRMDITILLRNRDTGVMRKIRKEYTVRDMRKIAELMQEEVKPNEAVIEVRLDADPLL